MGIQDYGAELNMIKMSVHFLIAEILDLDIMNIEPVSHIDSDLKMSDTEKLRLRRSIMEMFDGFEIDYLHIMTVQDIVNQIITCKTNTTNMTLH